jgi:hypothetical protein
MSWVGTVREGLGLPWFGFTLLWWASAAAVHCIIALVSKDAWARGRVIGPGCRIVTSTLQAKKEGVLLESAPSFVCGSLIRLVVVKGILREVESMRLSCGSFDLAGGGRRLELRLNLKHRHQHIQMEIYIFRASACTKRSSQS